MYCREVVNFNASDILGIAIRSNFECNHLAVIVHDGDSPYIIHLTDHYNLRKDEVSDSYSWIQIPSIDDFNKIHFAAHSEATYELNKEKGIPFAPCGGGSFDAQGNYIGDVGAGMTCSLFVKELFESQGYFFIENTAWPIRSEDITWQEDILRDFEHLCEQDIALADHQGNLVGKTLRFRPEEVAASVTFEKTPNNFDHICPISSEINKELAL